MGCTPLNTLNSNVSCESLAVPEYQPDTDRLPEIELSPELASRMAARMFNPAAPDLATRLPAPLWERVTAAGAKLGLPEPLLQRLSPGLAALLFAVPADETDISVTIDGQLYEHSQTRGLGLSALETIDEQLDLFDQLKPAQAQALLAESLDDFAAGYPHLSRLLDAYISGDEHRIATVVEAEFKEPSVSPSPPVCGTTSR